MIPSILAATSDADWPIITGLVVILVSAAAVAVVTQPVRLAAIPAYLIAGGRHRAARGRLVARHGTCLAFSPLTAAVDAWKSRRT